ncbi:DNA modification methylase [Candidatus Magnetobacterium bavaricum]|uniref:Methyltransferase n=1 Tax=Candidatus Magnetobacterium bavaricum TaxID=29290 RepID=A0A0F3GNQ0_9BACT|nr:DNA modification methylase [Candidatus Magnetobacterium bavaricum]
MNTKYLYKTKMGRAIVGDSIELLRKLHDDSVDLVITSPPFALQRQKEYGNREQNEYVNWLLLFTQEVKRVLKNTGSFVLDLGGAYQKGRPIRSLYNYRILIRMCDEQGWHLAEEFFWFNPAKLPSPIEWVNKRKIRVKDAVNTIWWLSKTDFPKANVKNVLTPYSERMKKLIENSASFYTPKKRPSGHDISSGFGLDNGGAIPSNMLQIPNTESNSQYLRYCAIMKVKGHPARFPAKLPEFFIKFLTDPNELVVDIFAGSNTTGAVAEQLNRKWLAFEINNAYLAESVFRFLPHGYPEVIEQVHAALCSSSEATMNLDELIELAEKKKIISPFNINESVLPYYDKTNDFQV